MAQCNSVKPWQNPIMLHTIGTEIPSGFQICNQIPPIFPHKKMTTIFLKWWVITGFPMTQQIVLEARTCARGTFPSINNCSRTFCKQTPPIRDECQGHYVIIDQSETRKQLWLTGPNWPITLEFHPFHRVYKGDFSPETPAFLPEKPMV